eukprot:4149608-Prymnesium_polylepis.1
MSCRDANLRLDLSRCGATRTPRTISATDTQCCVAARSASCLLSLRATWSSSERSISVSAISTCDKARGVSGFRAGIAARESGEGLGVGGEVGVKVIICTCETSARAGKQCACASAAAASRRGHTHTHTAASTTAARARGRGARSQREAPHLCGGQIASQLVDLRLERAYAAAAAERAAVVKRDAVDL